MLKSESVSTNQKGLAMILVVSLIGLLSVIGVWLIQESGLSHRMTSAMVRSQSAFNQAEGGLQLGIRCVKKEPPYVGINELRSDNGTKMTDVPDYIQTPPTHLHASLEIWCVDVDTSPPPGWGMNKQAYSGYYTVYYRPESEGTAASRKGTARTRLYSLTGLVTR